MNTAATITLWLTCVAIVGFAMNRAYNIWVARRELVEAREHMAKLGGVPVESYQLECKVTTCELEWHKSPPPHVGWWLTENMDHSFRRWRWWDGRTWSFGITETAGYIELAQATNSPYRGFVTGGIEWCYYWPANARVPRINPETLEETS